jgi:hypothetical protein
MTMGAAKIIQTTIHCDECDYEFAGDIPEWHNKACPECGAGVLVTDADLAVWNGMQALVDLSNALFPETTDADMTDVQVNTAALRELRQ